MPSVRFVLAPARRRLLRSLTVGSAVAAAVLAPGAVAQADEPSGSTVVGRLVQAWPDSVDGAHTDPISWVQNAEGDAVRIPTEDVEGIPTGTTLQVTVDSEDDGAADPLHEVTATRVVAAAPAEPVLRDPAGFTNQVTVVRVAPDGVAPDAVTAQKLVDVVDGPVADFWAEQSNGAIALGVTATRDWVSPAAGCADPTAMWNEVATTVGFVPGPGKHLLLYVSSAATTCSYALAEVGSSPATGGRMYVRDTVSSVIAHELGHNFGLGHSSARQCDAAVESDTCRTAPYRDYYDVMGVSWAQLGSLNVAQAARLGVLPAAQQQALPVTGAAATVTLAPLSGSEGTRALRLTDAEGVDYWLEYRTPTGRDAWLGTAANRYRLQTGVLLRRAESLPDTSVLLDGTPGTAASWDGDLQSALSVGAPVSVSGGDFTVVVQSVTAAGAVLTVTPTPSAAPATPAPRQAATVPGSVLPASAEGIPAKAGDSAGFVTPQYDTRQALHATPALESAAESTTGSGLLAPLAGAVLAASALFVVRTMRRSRARRA
ncbi:reprolysin-like metallopeptidase [Blastococcus sp. CT_GayMR16]|uniref:reprolysin-like metallopeptidase n=1 Tax=Blastococcus sp. CT_GayMR16 TaxID=2559607 RepID=UPI0010732204|nr:zinc-dependent metalloprotease family protein [Blastococcus sp. CT_GayMR16]TFV87803.1 hypothetical protein E4P38_12580 [Blastococcus sp. CT_GayMR16]